MRVFIGVSFNRDHETQIVGATDSREATRRLVEQARSEMLSFSDIAVDGPDGGVALDDAHGNMVGHVLACDVAGAAVLNWAWDSESDSLQAASGVYHDQGSSLCYAIEKHFEYVWQAMFEGSLIHTGSLEECMAACRKSEDAAVLDAVQCVG